MFHVDVQEELKPRWQAVVDRHVSVALTPLRPSLHSAHVRFSSDDPLGNDVRWFRCEIDGRGHNGKTYRFHAQHVDGCTALVDALARVRREIVRDRRWGPGRR